MFFLLKSDVENEVDKVLARLQEKMKDYCRELDVTTSQPPSKVTQYGGITSEVVDSQWNKSENYSFLTAGNYRMYDVTLLSQLSDRAICEKPES